MKRFVFLFSLPIFFAACQGTPASQATLAPTAALVTNTPTPTTAPSPSPTAAPLADLGIIVKVIEKPIDGAINILVDGVERTATTVNSEDLISLTELIPPIWLASQESLAGYEISIEPFPVFLDTCKYDEGWYITQAKVDVDVEIKNLSEGNIIANKSFTGTQFPPGCPGTINPATDRLLDPGLPDVAEFKYWLIQTILANTKLPAPPSRVLSLDFSPDGTVLALAGEDHTAKFLDISTGEISMVLAGHTGIVKDIAFSPDGLTLASGSEDGTAKLWETATGLELHAFNIDKANPNIVFSTDGNILLLSDLSAGLYSRQFMFWDMSRLGKSFGAIPYDYAQLSPDGKSYVGIDSFHDSMEVRDMSKVNSGPWEYDRDASLYYYEVAGDFNDDLFRPLILDFSFSDNGKNFAFIETGGNGQGFRLSRVVFFDPETWQKNLAIEMDGEIDNISFSPDGQILATQTADKIVLWDALTGNELRTIKSIEITSIAFSPDGKLLAAGSQAGLVEFWDVKTGDLLFEFVNTFYLN